jgi:hypothetical protein
MSLDANALAETQESCGFDNGAGFFLHLSVERLTPTLVTFRTTAR